MELSVLCRECGRLFLATTDSVISGTRKKLAVWKAYEAPESYDNFQYSSVDSLNLYKAIATAILPAVSWLLKENPRDIQKESLTFLYGAAALKN